MQAPFDIAADLDTPVSAYLKLGSLQPRFLLESVEGGERLARYSFLGFGDALEVRMDHDACTLMVIRSRGRPISRNIWPLCAPRWRQRRAPARRLKACRLPAAWSAFPDMTSCACSRSCRADTEAQGNIPDAAFVAPVTAGIRSPDASRCPVA